MMRRICTITQENAISTTLIHCSDNYKGYGWTDDNTFQKFVIFKNKNENKIMYVHLLCPKYINFEHKDCDLLNIENKDKFIYECRLVPQAKIIGFLKLDRNSVRKIHLQLINEPFCTNNIYSPNNRKSLHASITDKCNVDYISLDWVIRRDSKHILVNLNCPGCGISDCMISDIYNLKHRDGSIEFYSYYW